MSLKLPRRRWDFNLKMDMSKIVRSQSMMAVGPKGSSNWSHLPNPQERPLKAGWLRKQRSIVKNWQQRYFVLKGQHLYYYKDEEELKPQGCMQLHGSAIQEAAATSEEVGRFIFEIIPVVFGQQLVETMVYEQKFGQQLVVPILVEKCAEFIRKHGLKEEGIFRLPGQDNLVKQLRDAFDAGERPSFDKDTDVHTVASLFKLYLRELPEPLIPWTQYEDFLLCGQLLTADERKGQQQLVKQLACLPQDNYNLLSYICRFLHEIQQNSTTNKMSVENLATVFGVNLIRPKVEDPASIMRGTPQIQKVMTTMISDHAKLFPVSKDVALPPSLQKSDSKKASVSRSTVGWDAAPLPLMPRAENRTPWQAKDDLEASSPELTGRSDPSAEDNGEPLPQDVLGMWTTQSRKRTQTLPNRKCFLNASPTQGKQSTDGTDIFSSDFWLSSSPSIVQPSPASSAGGHKRTLSQGLSKWFIFPQASNSDKIRSSPVETRKQTCESPLTSVSDISGKGLLPSESSSPGQEPVGVPDLSPEGKSSPPEDPKALRKVIMELKKEMETQKKDYEEQIKSLEKENYDVWAKVVRLNKEIEKEKEKIAELESKLQNVECSCGNVEEKNKLLEDSLKSMSQLAENPK
ncbi:rho GTPase-activating protein 25 isoform X3 [Hemicordylus capensis]|uniref:rho GTPase-activating protein 25 isoform X3 n=1 Tax=Hemicordylus capensis TaxID=884348 RepID=UPI002303DF48|nr:rho GTPase-activating protein 25 isoform X3 [Hemicordylus capensis]